MGQVRWSSPPWIIWWAIAMHLAWGFAIAVDASVLPVAILVGLHWLVALHIGGVALGILLIVAALLAAGSLLLGHRLSNRLSLALLLPQYALLVAAVIADIQSIASGKVDGNPVDRLLLFTALWPVMIAAVLHSFAIFERHVRWTNP